MSAIGLAVRRLREERGWTQEQLGLKVGLDSTNIARRENGKTKIRPPERVKFAEAFDLPILEFDRHWRQWNIERTCGGPGIPIINKAPAGLIIDYEEYGIDSGQGYEYIDRGDITDHLAFGVIVVGDSMMPTLRDGDQVVLTPVDPFVSDGKLTDGKIVFTRFVIEHGGGCTLARFFSDGQGRIRLHKDNPTYKPILCEREVIQAMAVAIERREKL